MPGTKSKSEPSEEHQPVAEFPGLVDLVLNERVGSVEFWLFRKNSELITNSRHDTGTKPNGKPLIYVPPKQTALPWLLPRAGKVTEFYKSDSDGEYFKDLQAWIERHIDLADQRYRVLIAAWIAHTYLVDLCSASPYIVFLGPPETGKSRTLAACIHPARRGILTMNAREAALIRYADECRATVGVDTVDFMEVIRDTKDFFAARTKNDGTLTTRVLDFKKGPFEGLRHYCAYGATMVASNTPLSDDVIASRSLVIQACEGRRRFLENVTAALARELRERGTAFRARVMLRQRKSRLPTVPDLAHGRLGDIMSGLAWAASICDAGSVVVLQELTTTFSNARHTEAADTVEVEVLRACLTLSMSPPLKRDRFKLAELVNHCNADRPGDRPLSGRRLAPILRTTLGLDVYPGAGNTRFVHMDHDKLAALAVRYGLQLGPDDSEEVNRPSE